MKILVLSAAIVLSLLSGCQMQTDSSQQTNAASSNMTNRNFPKMIENPKTSLELLQNLKHAFDDKSMENDAFYTDENLKNVTGGQSVLRESATELYVQGFGNMVPDAGDESYRYPGISVYIQRDQKPSLNNLFASTISVELKVDDPNLNFASLETLFGKTWQPLPATEMHVDNNQLTIMNYKVEEGNTVQTARFVFNANSYLQQASFTVYNSTGSK